MSVGNIAPSASETADDGFNVLNRTVQQYDRQQYYYYVGVLRERERERERESERESERPSVICCCVY